MCRLEAVGSSLPCSRFFLQIRTRTDKIRFYPFTDLGPPLRSARMYCKSSVPGKLWNSNPWSSPQRSSMAPWSLSTRALWGLQTTLSLPSSLQRLLMVITFSVITMITTFIIINIVDMNPLPKRLGRVIAAGPGPANSAAIGPRRCKVIIIFLLPYLVLLSDHRRCKVIIIILLPYLVLLSDHRRCKVICHLLR